MKKHNKFLRYFLSFVFIFLIGFGNINISEAAGYKVYGPKQSPDRIRLQRPWNMMNDLNPNNPKNDPKVHEITVGTYTAKGVKEAKREGKKTVWYPKLPTVGQSTTATAHPSTSGHNFICLEKGVFAHWGGEYRKTDEINDEKMKALVAYAQNKKWDHITLQALIWRHQGSIKLNSKYQTYWDEFERTYNRDKNNPIFKNVRIFEYVSVEASKKWQKLLGFEYQPEVEVNLKKDEQSLLQKGEKAHNIAPKLYKLNNAVYGVYKSRSDAQNNRNPYKKVTLKYSGGNKAVVSSSVKVEPNTTYYVKEITAPEGYKKNPNIKEVKVETSAKTVNLKDSPIGDPLSILINKENERKTKLGGAQFEIKYYNDLYKSVNEAENYKPTKRWVIQTDESGYAELSEQFKINGDNFYKDNNSRVIGLKGTYTIKEIKAPDGHYIPKDQKTILRHIKGDSKYTNLVTFEDTPFNIKNDSQKGVISLDKIDKETRKSLDGIKFDIKFTKKTADSDFKEGRIVDTLTMGTKNESIPLPVGEYELIERKDSIRNRGYVLMKEPFKFIIEGNDTGSEWASYRNQKNHPNKVAANADYEGKDFKLFITLDNIPQKGRLTLIKKAPMLTGTKSEDKLGYKITTPRIEMGNLPGTVWQLIAAEDIISKDGVTKFYSKGDVVEELTTTKTSVTSKEHPLGKYILKEKDAPRQYTIDLDEYDVEFSPQDPEIEIHSVTQTRQNERKDIDFNFEKEFEGSENFTRNPEAIFGLYLNEDYKENGVTIPKDTLIDVEKVKAVDSYKNTEKNNQTNKSFEIKEFRTTKVDDKSKPIYKGTTTYEVTVKRRDGEETTKIFSNESDKDNFINEEKEKGSDIKEVKEPTRELKGYEKKDKKEVVKIHTVDSVEKKDQLENSFKKADIEFETKEIPYQGRDDQGKVVNRQVKGKFKDVAIDGKFYIKEIKHDNNYVLDNNKYFEKDFTTQTKKSDKQDAGKFTNRLIRVSINAVKFEEGSKEDKGAIPVEGAVYQLVAVDDKKGETQVGTYTTDSNGQINIENLEPGHYYLQEISSPKDYFLNDEKIPFDITGDKVKDGETVRVEMTDEKIPKIQTTATDNNTGKKRINPTELVEIKDKVRYEDLVIGKEYTIKGKLMFKDTNEPVLVDGEEVTAQKVFRPTQRNGYEELVFAVPGNVVRGKETVVFEKLYRGNREVTAHEDIFDEGQTTTVVNPEIGTRFADITANDKILNPISVVKLEDKVFFKDLVVGEEYELTMNLWDKKTNDFLKDKNGNKLTVRKTFVPKVENGTVGVSITLDLKEFRDVDITALESLSYKGEIMATHLDKEDKNQTIRVLNPEIKTKFATIDGKKIAQDNLYDITLEDTVKYKDLVPNKVYKMHLTVMDKNTKNKLVVNGKTVETELIFRTPKESNQENGGVSGEVKLTANTNLSLHRGKDIVAFETLSYTDENVDDEIIARHEDFDDENQTIRVASYALPITGSDNMNKVLTVGIILTTIGLISTAVVMIYKKHRSIEND